jgi:hypothetical protein
VIEIWELKNDLAAGWPFVPFVHMSGLHAAGMHKIDFPQELCLEKCVGDLATFCFKGPYFILRITRLT